MSGETMIAIYYIVVVSLLCLLLWWLINSVTGKHPKKKYTPKSITPENYGAVIDPWAEVARLRRALELIRRDRDALLKVRDELIDIAHGQTMFDEFNKCYTHRFMSDGEALWRLLGFDDKRPYIQEAEFDAAVQRFKDKGGACG